MTLVCPGRPRPDAIVCTHSLGRIASITSIKSGRSSWSASGRASDARARVPIRRLPRISPAFHAHRATRRDLLDHRASLAHTLKRRASYLLYCTRSSWLVVHALRHTLILRNTRSPPWSKLPTYTHRNTGTWYRHAPCGPSGSLSGCVRRPPCGRRQADSQSSGE